MSDPMPVALLGWKAMRKNTLRGFASIRLGRSLIIEDITVHASNGKRWVGMPGKPITDQTGNAKRDDTGKIKYVSILRWTDREAQDRFSEAVIAAVERENPGATAE